MNDNQRTLLRKTQWILYPFGFILLIDIGIRIVKGQKVSAGPGMELIFSWVDTLLFIAVFISVIIILLAILQQYFFKNNLINVNKHPAAEAELLIKIKRPNQIAGTIILLSVAIGFSVLLNIFLVAPELIITPDIADSFTILEKALFRFFYIVSQFILIVFILSLVRKPSSVFIATEKGFYYEPTGISTGWLLWSDIASIKESTILKASFATGPAEDPVLGIKLHNPQSHLQKNYASLLIWVLQLGQRLNNYQTDGAGDILLRPSDFGNEYGKIKALFQEKVSAHHVQNRKITD